MIPIIVATVGVEIAWNCVDFFWNFGAGMSLIFGSHVDDLPFGDSYRLEFTFQVIHHQTFQVPKMEVLTYISCMDTAYARENPPPK